jgi:hypothetical protein
MTNAGVGDTAVARDRSDKPPVSKKKEIKPTAKKSLPQKFDFLKWLEMYAAGVQSEKLVTIIPQLSNELQNLASELVIASGETTDKPTAKFKIEKLPIDFVRIFRTKVRNPFYLIFLLCNSSTELTLKKLIIQDLSKFILGKDDIEYLLNKMGGIKDSNTQQVVWIEFLTCGILQQEAWSVIS